MSETIKSLKSCDQKQPVEINSKTLERSKPFEEIKKDVNLSVKLTMAEELKEMGLSEGAICRQLNINYIKEVEVEALSGNIDTKSK